MSSFSNIQQCACGRARHLRRRDNPCSSSLHSIPTRNVTFVCMTTNVQILTMIHCTFSPLIPLLQSIHLSFGVEARKKTNEAVRTEPRASRISAHYILRDHPSHHSSSSIFYTLACSRLTENGRLVRLDARAYQRRARHRVAQGTLILSSPTRYTRTTKQG